MPIVYLVVALVGAAFTLLALGAPRHPAVLSFPFFMAGWFTGELALFHIAWQAVASVVFVALGALDGAAGWVGLAVTLVSWLGLWFAYRRHGLVVALLDEALREQLPDQVEAELGGEPAPRVPAVSRRQLLSPVGMRSPHVECIRDLAYGEHRRNRLDVYRRRDGETATRVLLQIHGGAWVSGNKRQQGQPLMYHLAERGWVCVAPGYRLAPRATFPDQLVDVKRALAWVRTHGPEVGADPSLVVVTGGSAGGHLAALLALTANDPRYQPGFEDVDTSVAACVPMYGVYDFLDRFGVRGRTSSMRPFLQRMVMKCSPAACPEKWEDASPISQVHADAPPFLVVHGVTDTLSWVEDARHFVEALRAVSRNPVLYAELPYTPHAFDVLYTVRTAHVVHAVARWLEHVGAPADDLDVGRTR